MKTRHWPCVPGTPDAETEAAIRETFVTSFGRSFDQDPRFGLIVMAEVGSRAMSGATNDAGTATEIITRLLSIWSKGREDEPVCYPRLHQRPLSDADMFDDAFLIMGRDGAHIIEIQLRLQKSLRALARMGSASIRAAALENLTLMQTRADSANMRPAGSDYLRSTLERIR